MLIEVALTKEIINKSLPVHYRHVNFKLRFLPYTTPIFLFLYGMVITIWQKDYIQGWERYIYLIVASVIAILLVLWTMHKRNSAGKKMLKQIGDRANHEIEANEDGIITRLNDATYNQKWTVYPKAIISKGMVLLYQQNKMFSIFHYTFFANDDFSRFKQLVRNHIHQVIED